MSRRAYLALFFFLSFILLGTQPLFADFKLLDAIQEFGEKRFVETNPGRHLKAGPVRIHPHLRTKSTYDSNILLQKDDPRDDVVFNITPGAILELPIDTHQLAVGYEADFEQFTHSRNANQNDQNQSMFALADIKFPDWYINVLEKFSETSGRSGTTFTDRIPRYDQSINPKIGYRWKRVVFETGFRHSVRDFRRQINDALDFQLSEWTQVLYYDLFARLKALLEYQFAQIDYDDDFRRNGSFNQVRIGLEGEVLPNMVVKLRVGPQFRNYRVSSKPDFYSWVADSRIEYQFRKNLLLKAGFSRQAVEATFADINFYKEHLLYTGFEYDIRARWKFLTTLRYYRHSYAERATIGDRSGYRRDQHIGVQTALRYDFKTWWQWELAYEFLRRHSNFSAFDYTDHQVSIASNFAY